MQKATELKFEAERKLGTMLKKGDRAQGKRTDLVPQGNEVGKPTLSELGISRKESSRAQMLTDLPKINGCSLLFFLIYSA